MSDLIKYLEQLGSGFVGSIGSRHCPAINEAVAEIKRLRNEQSKLTRKLTECHRTIEQLHERLAAIQSSKRNKASQIARLKSLLDKWKICERCGQMRVWSRDVGTDQEVVCVCECAFGEPTDE